MDTLIHYIEYTLEQYRACWSRLDFAGLRALWDTLEPEPTYLPEESASALLYFADAHVREFMDPEYNQYEIEPENLGDMLKYLEDAMPCEVVFYEGKAISVEMPTTVVREVEYTEPAVKGDTSGKVMKPAPHQAHWNRDLLPGLRGNRRQDRDRYGHGRIPQPGEIAHPSLAFRR